MAKIIQLKDKTGDKVYPLAAFESAEKIACDNGTSNVQTELNKVRLQLNGLSIWVGAESEKGTDANTIYICTS